MFKQTKPRLRFQKWDFLFCVFFYVLLNEFIHIIWTVYLFPRLLHNSPPPFIRSIIPPPLSIYPFDHNQTLFTGYHKIILKGILDQCIIIIKLPLVSWYPGILPGYQDARIPGYQDTRIPVYTDTIGYQNTRIPGYYETGKHDTRIPDYKDTVIPGYQDTRIPGYQDARMPGYQDTRIPGYQDTRITGCQDNRIPRYKDIRIPGYQDTKWMTFQNPDRINRYNPI